MKKEFDVVIVGNGAAGLFTALHMPTDKHIAIITKGDMEESDSFLAQGGICVLKNEEDYQSYFEDTMRAGHYENNRESVEIMIRSSQNIIRELVDFGVDFERDHGEFKFTREGAHTAPRILYHEDLTGKEITSKLLTCAKDRPNIEIYTHTTMVDIIEKDNTCYGVMIEDADHQVHKVLCDYTIWACGGIGGLYQHSTNFRQLTGDALAIALHHNVELLNVDYVQIHPTTFYSEDNERRFLISESVRGEGALLYDKNGNRFVNELLPRDVVSEAIKKQMEKDGLIHNLQLQVPFELIPPFEIEIDGKKRKRRRMEYIADFVYYINNVKVVEDVKGRKTEVYKIKKKIFEYKFKTTIKET